MPIPDYQTPMRPFVAALSSGKPRALSEIHDSLCDEFQLTPEEVAQRIPSGKQTIMHNRVGWTRTYPRARKGVLITTSDFPKAHAILSTAST